MRIYRTKYKGILSIFKPINDIIYAILYKIRSYTNYISISDTDIISPNVTIANMALELIKRHRLIKRPYFPLIDNIDVPSFLIVQDKPLANISEKWDYILCEIEYGLNSIVEPCMFSDGTRAQNGLRLFGKYFNYLTL